MKDVGGAVLACKGVKNLGVNSDLDMLPLSVTYLKIKKNKQFVCREDKIALGMHHFESILIE